MRPAPDLASSSLDPLTLLFLFLSKAGHLAGCTNKGVSTISQTFTAPTHSLSRMTLLRVKKFLNTQLCPRCILQQPRLSSGCLSPTARKPAFPPLPPQHAVKAPETCNAPASSDPLTSCCARLPAHSLVGGEELAASFLGRKQTPWGSTCLGSDQPPQVI